MALRIKTSAGTIRDINTSERDEIRASLGIEDAPVVPAPVFTSQPTITGTSQVGQVLTAVDGAASNITTLTRKWYMDDSEIVGDTGSTYAPTTGDVGKVPGLRNFATGPGGGPVQSSLATAAAVIAAAGGATAPGAPTIGTATAGDGTVSVAFTAPASNGGSAILDYQVLLSTGQSATGASSPISVTAPNGTPVTATVRARNAVDYGLYSAASNSVTPSVAAVYGATETTRLIASARVKLGGGRLVSISNAGANSATITAYDNHSSSGRVIYTGTITSGSTVNLTGAWAVHGIYIALSGTSPSVDFITTEI